MDSIMSIVVHATLDEEASVWVATSNDIEGLAVEADTMEELEPRVKAALSDLIELNGISSKLAEIPVYIMTLVAPDPWRDICGSSRNCLKKPAAISIGPARATTRFGLAPSPTDTSPSIMA
jgi:hypothetical protein